MDNQRFETIRFLNSLIILPSSMDMVGLIILALVINEDIGFCFSIDDSAAVMCHCFI